MRLYIEPNQELMLHIGNCNRTKKPNMGIQIHAARKMAAGWKFLLFSCIGKFAMEPPLPQLAVHFRAARSKNFCVRKFFMFCRFCLAYFLSGAFTHPIKMIKTVANGWRTEKKVAAVRRCGRTMIQSIDTNMQDIMSVQIVKQKNTKDAFAETP